VQDLSAVAETSQLPFLSVL